MTEALKDIYIEEKIDIYLLLLKIGANLAGYKMIKSCVMKIIKDNTKKFRMRKNLYYEIACENNISPEDVDRLMRHAVKVSFKRDGLADFERQYDIEFSKERPSPRELVCVLAELYAIGKH